MNAKVTSKIVVFDVSWRLVVGIGGHTSASMLSEQPPAV